MYGLLIYEKADAMKNTSFIEYLIHLAENKGIMLEFMLYEDIVFGIRNNGYFIDYMGKPINRPEFVIYRSREYLLSRHFESMGIRTFNSSKVCEICNNKAATYQFVANLGLDVVPTEFIKNSMLAKRLKQYSGKHVVKAVSGHGGSQVVLVDEKYPDTYQEAIEKMGTDDVVIQPYITGRGQDLRVYVVGGVIIAAVLRSANGDFRANFSLGGSVGLYELSKEEYQIVTMITNALSLDYAGIDFIIDEDGTLIFNEIEDVVGARMLYQSSDIDAAMLYLEHIINITYK